MFLDQPIRLLGQSPTIGIRITLADGFHYGLIQFDWRVNPADDGGFVWMYQPIRWAYEAEPNVPITVPAPVSTVALLALAVITPRRRRSA